MGAYQADIAGRSAVCFIVRCLARAVAPLLAAVAISGCSGPTIPPPSAFYATVDLEAVVKKCAPKNVEWGAAGHGQGGGGSPSNFHRDNSFDGDLKCDAGTLEAFVQALKAELPKAVAAHGGRVTSSVTLNQDEFPKAIARRGIKHEIDGKPVHPIGLSGFQLDYEVGTTRGEILVIASQYEVPPNSPFPLSLSIDVFEGTSVSPRPVKESKPSSAR
jgi:hypothetical protein